MLSALKSFLYVEVRVPQTGANYLQTSASVLNCCMSDQGALCICCSSCKCIVCELYWCARQSKSLHAE